MHFFLKNHSLSCRRDGGVRRYFFIWKSKTLWCCYCSSSFSKNIVPRIPNIFFYVVFIIISRRFYLLLPPRFLSFFVLFLGHSDHFLFFIFLFYFSYFFPFCFVPCSDMSDIELNFRRWDKFSLWESRFHLLLFFILF